MEECLEKLNVAWVDMGKTIKVATSITNKALMVSSGQSAKFYQVQKECNKALESIEGVYSDLGYLIKFKKSRQHQQLTPDLAKQVLAMCASGLTELIDASKVLQAMTPTE